MSNKPTLLVLAAGMGSRYGGIKQLDQFGPNGETIIDYSLYDAIKAGFGKIVFIVRKDIHEAAVERFSPKLKGRIDFDFADQELTSYVPEHLQVERSKPWGTAHAVLCAKESINEPFAVINADDFYGYDAFKTMADFLSADTDPATHSLVGYRIENTLSDHGTVSRGVCQTNERNELVDINERHKVGWEGDKIVYNKDDQPVEIPEGTPVSMNFWGFKPGVFALTEEMFRQYAQENIGSPKAEFLIPFVAAEMIRSGKAQFKVFESTSKWFGVTYQEDKPIVKKSLKALVDAGEYPEKLWE